MRRLFRALSTLALLAAVAAFGHELQLSASEPTYRIVALGELWAWLHANSLIGLQAAIEGASPWLWRAIALPILMGPAWAFALGLGIVLRVLGGRAHPRTTTASVGDAARLRRGLQQLVRTRARRKPGATSATTEPKRPSPEPATPDRSRGTPQSRREPTVIRRS